MQDHSEALKGTQYSYLSTFSKFLQRSIVFSFFVRTAEHPFMYVFVTGTTGIMRKATLLAALVIMAYKGNAATYYVSAKGNDAANGTSTATPWQSIAKVNASTFKPGDFILFNRGDTFFGALTINQSGTPTSLINYGAYGSGAIPIITGFSSISSWISDGGSIYEYTCSSCQPTLNMVTVDDTLQPMGRWPRVSDANEGYLVISSHNANTSISSNQIAGASSYVGGEIVIRKLQYVLDRARILAQTSTTVTYAPFLNATIYTATDLFGFFIQNHVNTLKKPGDWCYDSLTKKIKMYGVPPNVKATTLSSLVNINNKSYININSISFQGANSNTFNIVSSKFIQINYCTISYSGINAISITNANSNNITIYDCTISKTNNNAIDANGSPNMSVTSNYISNTGMVRGAGQSGGYGYIALSQIGNKSYAWHNQITNTGYTGIKFTGDSVIIKNNLLNDFCMVLNDGGAIYSYGNLTQTGRIIRGNLILNGIGDRYGMNVNFTNPYTTNVHGIYMDLGTRNVLVDSNTVYNCSYDGLELSGNIGVQILHNTFYDNGDFQADIGDGDGFSGYAPNVTFKHNILFSSRADQGIFNFDFFKSGSYSTMGVFDSNYYCRPIYEPTGIITHGYKHGTNWAFPYSDGGIISYRPTNDFYSLDTWKTLTGQEAHTVKTPISITQSTEPASSSIDTAVLFEYNSSTTTKTISLGNNKYIDVLNHSYSGTVNLAPYTSLILIYTGQVVKTSSQDSITQLSVVETAEVPNSSPTERLLLFPNPAHGLLNLQLTSASNGNVFVGIYDMNGKLVQQMQTYKGQNYIQQSFNISGLSSGVYNLQVLIGYHKKMITQFIKN